MLKNQIQLNFTHLRFNFSLNTNPNSLFLKKKKYIYIYIERLNGFIRIVNSKYKNYMVTIWIAYGENIIFRTQLPNKIIKIYRKGKRVYLCESRMEIKAGQIDGLGAFDEDWISEWDSTFFYILNTCKK